MDSDRLGSTSPRLARRVQGLTGGHWAIVAVLAALAIVGGWAWTSWPTEDSDPWITLSVTRTAEASGSENSIAGDPRAIATALKDAGLDGYRFQGNSLQVKASQVERTLATLERNAAPEDTWTARWEDQVGQLGAFPTTAQYEQAREIALRKEIRQLLTAVPEIAEVQVLLARSRAPRSFGSRGRRVTATIGIKRDSLNRTPLDWAVENRHRHGRGRHPVAGTHLHFPAFNLVRGGGPPPPADPSYPPPLLMSHPA